MEGHKSEAREADPGHGGRERMRMGSQEEMAGWKEEGREASRDLRCSASMARAARMANVSMGEAGHEGSEK